MNVEDFNVNITHIPHRLSRFRARVFYSKTFSLALFELKFVYGRFWQPDSVSAVPYSLPLDVILLEDEWLF